jgi:hypothetical protein
MYLTLLAGSIFFLANPLRKIGVLQSMGALLPGNSEQAHVDRRASAHALHPLGSGVLLLSSGV